MVIVQYTKTLYPQTVQGRKLAFEVKEKLEEQGFFLKYSEDTSYIVIEAKYRFVVEEEGEE